MNDEQPRRGSLSSVPGLRRVSHGLYLPHGSGFDGLTETLRDLSAWQLVLPGDAVWTHLTASWLYGWWLPRLPEHTPVFAATTHHRRPRRAGLICSRHLTIGIDRERRGQPVDAPELVLLRCARDLAVLDLVPLIESAVRSGDTDLTTVQGVAAYSRPGVRRLRQALVHVNVLSESAWESMLRIFHELAGIPVEPQVVLHDEGGRFVARADLLVTGTRDVHEYDGGVHDAPGRRTRDLRRSRLLVEADYVRRGFTAPDLVVTPSRTLRELDRAVGRIHDPRRLRAWLALLKDSCHTQAGRDRLQNRWLASTLWSQSA